MPKHMLIDSAHAEETRVAVVDGRHVEEFDFESRARRQLRGNIYLAKVTRVEPSLQAAFVEYGGNRHGFLAFSEIHPDYYQIPVADREAIMAEADDEEDDQDVDGENGHDDEEGKASDEARLKRKLMRRYKIQEVIKRRQIMLVQVVKDERGGKGAALTTWLSLAGRYCVLMPNSGRGGGISRKITQAADRKRLKAAAQSLDVPPGMGLIIRTAGAKRTKAEIKRDYEYLLRLWEDIRSTTLASTAPSLIYEEETLVRRAVRDMFDKDFEAVHVQGEQGWREARDFMRQLMPSQAKKVQLYDEPTPLFVKFGVEDMLQQIHSPVVPLKSGGYLVINQTEALVAIDVNSGKATKERNVEATALKTNLEAADEAARQLRLRDLAGLIVIDFIDMDEGKNNRAVEKRLKDALDEDRARIQMGKISGFGLMEISRQRRRTGVLEGTTHICEHCGGSGRVRSAESLALTALRSVEMEAAKNGAGAVTLRAPMAVALYVLNHKREFLNRMADELGLDVTVQVDDALGHAEHAIERTVTADEAPRPTGAVNARRRMQPTEEDLRDEQVFDDGDEPEELADGSEDDAEDSEDDSGRARPDRGDGEGRRGRRRRRRGRGGRREDGDEAPRDTVRAETEQDGEDEAGRRRRRGRRGGRRAREGGETSGAYAWVRGRTPSLEDPYVWFDPIEMRSRPAQDEPARERPAAESRGESPAPAPAAEAGDERGGRRRVRRKRPGGETQLEGVTEQTGEAEPVEAIAAATAAVEAADASEAQPEPEAAPAPAKRTRSRRKPAATEAAPEAEAPPAAAPEAPVVEAQPEPEPQPAAEPAQPAEPDPAEITAPPVKPKRGWWSLR
ncbi:ribonuclease E/G [Brevundimonas sp. 2R-24]|uniref:Ribonuclease E n=1 Tax=Peiella sedimenti TaxID=3061083 RepID=A0ABT8SIP6_9CAUL|nr:ribonuclease E/G [Caulobacteraceae bacterium XZ-24]